MIRDITLGQYYFADSTIHRMDPRTKIIGTFVYIASLFICKNIYVYAIAFAFLMLCIFLCKVPIKYICRGMKAITYILIITMIFNMFFTRGETVLWRWKALVITLEGIRNAAFMASRLIMLVVGCSIMTFTTMPSNLTDGLESVMHPLKYIKVPVHEIAMMMSIALRFIPILMEETDKIMKAQLARGADFENGSIVKRVKNYIPVLVPLFVASFRRANELTLAMESRCYRGGENRTRMKPLKYHKRDAVAYITMFAYLGIIIFLAIYLSPKDSTDAAALAGSINMQ